MNHFTVASFWESYNELPKTVQLLADKNYQLLKLDPNHPSLHYKKINKFRSVRIGLKYRALGIEDGDGIIWFWIGDHKSYDKIIAD